MNQKQESFGRFDFVGKAWFFGGISLILTTVALLWILIKGVPYGIDFAGGTELQVKFAQSVTIDEVRSLAEKQKLQNVGVQGFGDTSEFIIRFQTPQGSNDKESNDLQNQAVSGLREAINAAFSAAGPEIRRVDSVGPQVGAELKRNGLLAVFYCLMVILIYVGIRFDFKYAPGAVICLFHDAVITLWIFSLSGKEVNIPILAAILTLIGYSLNDTIVVFDRIRETEHESKSRGLSFVINKAVNDMLARTLITAGTTFVSSLCLYLFAGGTVSDIAFALCIGILFGSYSSVFVAAPLVLLVEKLKELRKSAAVAKA